MISSRCPKVKAALLFFGWAVTLCSTRARIIIPWTVRISPTAQRVSFEWTAIIFEFLSNLRAIVTSPQTTSTRMFVMTIVVPQTPVDALSCSDRSCSRTPLPRPTSYTRSRALRQPSFSGLFMTWAYRPHATLPDAVVIPNSDTSTSIMVPFDKTYRSFSIRRPETDQEGRKTYT